MLYSRNSLLIHSKSNSLHLLTPHSQSILLPPALVNHKYVFQVHEFIFCGKVCLCQILDSSYKWYHMEFVFLFLIYLVWESLIPCMLLQMALFCSFLWVSSIPLSIYIYHIFLIHSSIDGHLGYFHFLAIVNSAAMNVRVHVSFSRKVLSR